MFLFSKLIYFLIVCLCFWEKHCSKVRKEESQHWKNRNIRETLNAMLSIQTILILQPFNNSDSYQPLFIQRKWLQMGHFLWHSLKLVCWVRLSLFPHTLLWSCIALLKAWVLCNRISLTKLRMGEKIYGSKCRGSWLCHSWWKLKITLQSDVKATFAIKSKFYQSYLFVLYPKMFV